LKALKILIHLIFCGFVWHWVLFFQPMAYAEEVLGEEIDCTDVSIYFVDDPNYTQEERLRLMDEAFLEALNKFELCQSKKKMAKASGGTEGDGAAGDSGNSAGETQSNSGGESIASPTMSGTQTPPEETTAGGVEAMPGDDLEGSQDNNKTTGKISEKITQSNGKLPEDIPPAKNDDAFAAQIRYAAENEPDPVKRKQLWDEYRKYKGLPAQ
jgi:hypothetical protein